jgi:hypothetical protein
MRGDVRVGSRVRPTAAKDVLHGLWAAALALLMASSVVSAQENSNQAGSSSTTKLPEIHVIATTPVASPRVTPRAPAAAPAPTRAPATTAAATEAAPKAVPGAVELDKIPSNVQTVGASAFDGTKAPDLLQSMDRALPGVSLSSQTGMKCLWDTRASLSRPGSSVKLATSLLNRTSAALLSLQVK